MCLWDKYRSLNDSFAHDLCQLFAGLWVKKLYYSIVSKQILNTTKMKSPRSNIPVYFLSFIALFFLIPQLFAQENTGTPSDSASQPTQVFVDSVSLRIVPVLLQDTGNIWSQDRTEAFFDGLMSGNMDARHIAGGTVSVVRNGRIIFSKGYGYADIMAGDKVEAASTMFLIGSVSKLFTWTAVMQLVERGDLVLDDDINTYLSAFSIPQTFDEPVTMRHLMTHTAGFEDEGRIFARNPEDIIPLEDYLKKYMPKRVRKPGEIASYSNYGSALAGYIVEKVSGISFEEYIEQNIYQPLGMDHSTFQQPPQESLRAFLSEGYSWSEAGFRRADPEYIHIGPAGIMASSATDMAKFMLAHLEDGAIDSTRRILSPESILEMHRQHFRHAPGMKGMCLGFYQMEQNGVRMIGHGGNTRYFHSKLALMPEQNTGIFISTNSLNGESAASAILEAFTDRYFPQDQTAESTDGKQADRELSNYEGYYRSNRMAYSTYEKVFGLMNVVKVSINKSGELVIGRGEEEGNIYLPVGSDKFASKQNPEETVMFKTDEKENISYLLMDETPFLALDKLPWYESPRLHIALLTISSLLFLLMVILWPVSMYVHQVRKASGGQTRSGMQHTALLTGRISSLAYLLFIAGFILLATTAFESFSYGIPPALPYLQALPIIGGILNIIALIFVPIAIRKKFWNRATRWQYALTAIMGIVFLVQLNYANLLAWNF